MINWPIIPMTYNDSFTYMEWLGKLTYIADNHETRIDDCEKNIIDLWEKVNNHETRITSLEDWRHDIVDPFIVQTNFRLGELENWKTNTVDPFITDITNWKTNVIDPFVTDISLRMTTAETNITNLKSDLEAESAARRNADNALDNKINIVNSTAIEALNKVNKINLDIKNVGAVRYFMTTATVAPGSNSGTDVKITVPDEDWVTCDVRIAFASTHGSNNYSEERITCNITDTSKLTITRDSREFSIIYNSANKEITVTLPNSNLVASDIKRVDYILYDGALTQAAQDQKDVDFFNAMDVTGDGKITATDATITLNYYTDASAGVIPAEYSGKEAWTYWANLKNTEAGSQVINPNAFPDFNEDGKILATDASEILQYYTWVSATDRSGMTGPQLMREYRTQREADSV